MSASACTGCTTHLFLFEDSVQSVFLFTCANLPVSQDHGSFEFVNQTVEKELYFDALNVSEAASQTTAGLQVVLLCFIEVEFHYPILLPLY